MKAEFNIVIENSKWLVGNGESVNFWLESWCGPPLATILNIHPNYWHHLLQRSLTSSEIQSGVFLSLCSLPFLL